jgi:hypothetical protein
MPAIANLPPKVPIVRVLPVADAFGDEGLFISEAAERAERHWEERAEWILTHSSESDELDYDIVPLDDAGAVRVRYKFAGTLEPMPYEWDD